MNDFQLLNIIVFGLVAGFIAFRLYSVLGRRTGQERSPDDELRLPGGTRPNPAPPPAKDNVVTLPERAAPAGMGVAAGPAVRALVDIKLADRNFDTERFLSGARMAYEMIVTAFAEGNRKMLRDLLSRDVMEGFSAAITEREKRGEVIDQSFVGINKADIVEAEGHTMVFCRTRHGADKVAKLLNGVGVEACALHGGMSQRQRDRA